MNATQLFGHYVITAMRSSSNVSAILDCCSGKKRKTRSSLHCKLGHPITAYTVWQEQPSGRDTPRGKAAPQPGCKTSHSLRADLRQVVKSLVDGLCGIVVIFQLLAEKLTTLTSCSINASGNIAVSGSAPMGSPSAPSGGTGGLGMSATRLYHRVGIPDCSSRILVSDIILSRRNCVSYGASIDSAGHTNEYIRQPTYLEGTRCEYLPVRSTAASLLPTVPSRYVGHPMFGLVHASVIVHIPAF
jgi:hypothetical protein